MKIENAAVSGAITSQTSTGADEIDRERHAAAKDTAPENTSKKVQPEEILKKIKSLTEEGSYSVRFEMEDKTKQMVVRLVDVESGDMIRQIPPEELIDLSEVLQELRGSLVDTTG